MLRRLWNDEGSAVAGQMLEVLDCTNNLLSNLRAATESEQNGNRNWKPLDERSESLKHRIGARHLEWPAMTPTLEFDSHHTAERALGVAKGVIASHISKMCKTGPRKGQIRAVHPRAATSSTTSSRR